MNNIPKIFFSYWCGNIMSYLQYLSVKSFQEHNPEWKIIIYMPEFKYDQITWISSNQKVKYQGKNYLDDLYKLDIEIVKINFEDIGFSNNTPDVHKSDYLRYYMLYKHGGLWSDMDILYIRPIEKIITPELRIIGDKNNINTIIAHFNTGVSHYSIGLLMSNEGNEFYKNLMEQSHKFYTESSYQCIGTSMINQLYPNPLDIKNRFPNLNICILNSYTYLPYAWNKINEIFLINRPENIKNYTIGIHWFNGDDKSKEYQMLLDQNKFPKTGSIYPYLQKYLDIKPSIYQDKLSRYEKPAIKKPIITKQIDIKEKNTIPKKRKSLTVKKPLLQK